MSAQRKIQQLFDTAKIQPFYVVTDEGYERMVNKLQNGLTSVKTYITTCPDTESTCTCPHFLSILNPDGDFPPMVRVVDGVVKPVFSESMFKMIKMLRKNVR
jgi:hypothetical protein